MVMQFKQREINVSPQEREQRKKYLTATLITCIALAMIFGVAHVVKLGANRMEDMRSRSGYDLSDESKHIRAAGEDIELHKIHEETQSASNTYNATELDVLVDKKILAELYEAILIPAGSFIVGTSSPRSDLQDQPQHSVNLPAYEIDKYPITNIQYAKYVAETKYRPPLDWEKGKIPDEKYLHPVVMVSWYDAKNYCEHYGKRLPTEFEWEKAARGTDARRWPWGNTMDPARLNTYYNIGATTVVTKYDNGKSVFGVMDMAGNVSEWTASKFVPYEGSVAPKQLFKPKAVVAQDNKDKAMKVGGLVELDRGEYKVRRGGSWKSDPFATSVYHRNYSLPHFASDFFGFRCVKDLK